tara:strand:- start:197 stop:823 length:627 start_codon:yes stop_codon:yes gene_type:complete
MAEFGWAYISCESAAEVAGGPTGSLQFHSGSRQLSGSSTLVWVAEENTLNLTGTLNISGTINANEMNINVTNKNVINLSASGDTKFGDTLDDTHQFTGSVAITGGISFNYYKLTSSPYTVQASDYIIGISSSAYVSITLPNYATNKGKFLIFKDEWDFGSGVRPSSAPIGITASAGGKLDGNGTYEISNGDFAAISLYSDGVVGWFVV